ncbi:hypothetical protein KKB18_12050 [bacterium]|nr:hypothetical protein [bacterium]
MDIFRWICPPGMDLEKIFLIKVIVQSKISLVEVLIFVKQSVIDRGTHQEGIFICFQVIQTTIIKGADFINN